MQCPKLEAEIRADLDAKPNAAGWAVQAKQRIDLYTKLGVAVREMHAFICPNHKKTAEYHPVKWVQ